MCIRTPQGRVWLCPLTFSSLLLQEYDLPGSSFKLYQSNGFTIWIQHNKDLCHCLERIIRSTKRLKIWVLTPRYHWTLRKKSVRMFFFFNSSLSYFIRNRHSFHQIYCACMKSHFSNYLCYRSKKLVNIYIESLTDGRRLLTLLSFELMPPKVDRWKTSAPRVAWACEITLSIYNTKFSKNPDAGFQYVSSCLLNWK